MTGKESNTVITGSTATKSSNGASSPCIRMKYLGNVASRWRNVARVPSATISERPSSFQNGFEPQTVESVSPSELLPRGHSSVSPVSIATSWRTRILRTKHEMIDVYNVKRAVTSTLTRIHERWPSSGSVMPSWKLARTHVMSSPPVIDATQSTA